MKKQVFLLTQLVLEQVTASVLLAKVAVTTLFIQQVTLAHQFGIVRQRLCKHTMQLILDLAHKVLLPGVKQTSQLVTCQLDLTSVARPQRSTLQ